MKLLTLGLVLLAVSADIQVQFSVTPDSCGRCEFKMKLFDPYIASDKTITK
jgi:hypothetical protein